MRVLLDIVHPAHVLFFRFAIQRLREEGATLTIASRRKDITIDLLDQFGFTHTPLTTAGRGTAQLAKELVLRDLRLFRLARAFAPDVMTGFGGVAISHVGRLLGVPSVSFYDSEPGRLQTLLTVPFVSEWHVPVSFSGMTSRYRTRRFRSIKPLSYLHPDHFRPDPVTARRAGHDPSSENFFVRLVGWQAAHDLGKSETSDAALSVIVSWLAARGRVHVSSEAPLPGWLEPFRYRGAASDVHHLIAHCRLVAGESATMAAEAAVLGVPAIFWADFDIGYIHELQRAELVQQAVGPENVVRAAQTALATTESEYRRRRDIWLHDKIDLVDYIVKALRRAAGSR